MNIWTGNSSKNTRAKHRRLDDLAEIARACRQQKMAVVLCHGVFDLMHPGHIRHLEAARREGDVLMVTVTADDHVKKGPFRPVFGEALRAESLAALAVVDYVAVSDSATAIKAIELLRPDVYVKGGEYANAEDDPTGMIVEEESAVCAAGGRVHFTDEVTFSSSALINRHLQTLSPEMEEWLREFRERRSPDEVIAQLDAVAGCRTLVVGEAIIDEYVSCDALGKTAKDPLLAFRYGSSETHAGGSLAVANHLAGVCREVGLVTLLGETQRREDFVRQALRPNVSLHLATQRHAPTVHKRRFVDRHTGNRLFELYVMEDAPLDARSEGDLLDTLSPVVGDYDLVIATDYCHGMMTPAVIDLVTDKSRFLAVNTQINAGNRGFNSITKYSRADYVCLAGNEVEFELRDRNAPRRDLVERLAERIDCPRFTVTLGQNGTMHYERGVGFTEVPAFAIRVVDRVGAGDAVLALTSLLARAGAPWDVTGFIANVVGAEMVANLGNRVSVERSVLTKHIMALLK